MENRVDITDWFYIGSSVVETATQTCPDSVVESAILEGVANSADIGGLANAADMSKDLLPSMEYLTGLSTLAVGAFAGVIGASLGLWLARARQTQSPLIPRESTPVEQFEPGPQQVVRDVSQGMTSQGAETDVSPEFNCVSPSLDAGPAVLPPEPELFVPPLPSIPKPADVIGIFPAVSLARMGLKPFEQQPFHPEEARSNWAPIVEEQTASKTTPVSAGAIKACAVVGLGLTVFAGGVLTRQLLKQSIAAGARVAEAAVCESTRKSRVVVAPPVPRAEAKRILVTPNMAPVADPKPIITAPMAAVFANPILPTAAPRITPKLVVPTSGLHATPPPVSPNAPALVSRSVAHAAPAAPAPIIVPDAPAPVPRAPPAVPVPHAAAAPPAPVVVAPVLTAPPAPAPRLTFDMTPAPIPSPTAQQQQPTEGRPSVVSFSAPVLSTAAGLHRRTTSDLLEPAAGTADVGFEILRRSAWSRIGQQADVSIVDGVVRPGKQAKRLVNSKIFRELP